MISIHLRIAALVILCCFAFPLSAQAKTFADMEGVIVCPTQSAEHSIPDFTAAACEVVSAFDVDPQDRQIWIKSNVGLERTSGAKNEPLALFVSGKMSTEVYLNGQFVGRNGQPGPDADAETPGVMDAIFYPDQSFFRVGNNEIVIKASSHQGYLHLRHPIHMIAIGPAQSLTDDFLRRYAPSLLTLGMFVLGVLFFGVLSLIGPARKQAAAFAVMSLFTAGQLMTEVYRGIAPYPYPMHDVRLILVAVFSAGFGMTVAFHVLNTFMTKHVPASLCAISAITAIAVYLSPGYDQKAELGMLAPLLLSLFASGFWAYRGKERAFLYCMIIAVFVTAIIMFPSLFLNVLFFFLVATFLLLLFLEQGLALARETREHAIEARRADRLALMLGQLDESDEVSEITVSSAGQINRIQTSDILYCRGASGYAEMILTDGRTLLHSATLTELEETLSQTFLRVHRSYLVNSKFIKKLERDTAGTGTLTLADGISVPVSRRIMPQVRMALS